MHYLFLVIAALIILGLIVLAGKVGEYREPLTSSDWALSVIFNGLFVYLLVDKFFQLNA